MQHIFQIGVGVMPVEFRRLDQAHDGSPTLAAGKRPVNCDGDAVREYENSKGRAVRPSATPCCPSCGTVQPSSVSKTKERRGVAQIS
jgi:hypothetical protein